MKNDIDIAKYLEGEMSEEEMIEIEVRCLYDSDFRKEVQTMELLMAGIKESAKETTLDEKLQRLESYAQKNPEDSGTHDTQKAHSRISLTRRLFLPLSIAASIVLVLFVTGIIPHSDNTSNEQLYADLFEVPPNYGPRQTRGNSKADFPTEDAYQAYDAQNYQLAATIFEENLDESPYKTSDLFHLGICYLILEDWDQAIEVLDEVAFSEVNLADEAKWYLALAYLRTGHDKMAHDLSEQIILPQERREKAREIHEFLQ